MKAKIIEIDREEIAPGKFSREFWSIVPFDQLSSQDTQEYLDRIDELWPQREAISSILMRRVIRDKEKRPHHFFKSISMALQYEKFFVTDQSKN